MSNHLQPKLLWISLLIHVFVILLIAISYRNSHIQKLFVAYGTHSRRVSHAYFREVRAPTGNYGKYRHGGKTGYKSPKTANSKFLEKKVAVKKAVKKESCKKAKVFAKADKLVTVEKFVKQKIKKLKKVVPKKKDVLKEEPKVTPEKKVPEVLEEETPKKEAQKQEEQVEPKELETQQDESAEPEESEVLHFNLMGESDPKVLIYQQHIQGEVDRLWRPPLGVPKGTECIATFEIDRDGLVKSFAIEKKSKMLIYDLSIVRVAKDFKFDECLWGKSFTINFRQ